MKSMMKRAAALLTALTVLAVTGCGESAKEAESPAEPTEKPVKTAKTANAAPRIAPEPIDISLVKLKITVDGKVMTANIEHNRTVLSFLGQLPLSLPMKNLYDREMCYHYGAGGLPPAPDATATKSATSSTGRPRAASSSCISKMGKNLNASRSATSTKAWKSSTAAATEPSPLK